MIIPLSPLRSPLHADRGLTLAEVMVALVIVTFASLGLVKLTYQMRVTAEDNIHQSTAYVMAQGYLEQLCRLPYSTDPTATGLLQIADDTAGTTYPIPVFDSTGAKITTLYNGGSYTQTVYLDQDSAGAKTYPMTFTFQPVLRDLSASTITNGAAQGVEIIVYFKESYTLAGATRAFQGSLRTVYGNVKTD